MPPQEIKDHHQAESNIFLLNHSTFYYVYFRGAVSVGTSRASPLYSSGLRTTPTGSVWSSTWWETSTSPWRRTTCRASTASSSTTSSPRGTPTSSSHWPGWVECYCSLVYVAMWTVHDIFFLAYSSVFPDIHTVFHEVTSINPPILGVDDRPKW